MCWIQDHAAGLDALPKRKRKRKRKEKCWIQDHAAGLDDMLHFREANAHDSGLTDEYMHEEEDTCHMMRMIADEQMNTSISING
jgi:hypothetical protein